MLNQTSVLCINYAWVCLQSFMCIAGFSLLAFVEGVCVDIHRRIMLFKFIFCLRVALLCLKICEQMSLLYIGPQRQAKEIILFKSRLVKQGV